MCAACQAMPLQAPFNIKGPQEKVPILISKKKQNLETKTPKRLTKKQNIYCRKKLADPVHTTDPNGTTAKMTAPPTVISYIRKRQ